MKIEATMKVSCATTSVTERQWDMWSLDASTLTVQKQLNLSQFLGQDSLTLVIPQNVAQIGFFLVQLTVTMSGTGVSNSIRGYISLVSSPLSVVVLPGGTSTINIGIQQGSYTFSPQTHSKDPNLKPDEAQNFDSWQWKCWRSDENEGMATATVQPKPGNFSFPAVRRGCFGDGPGTLSTTSGTQTWDMANFEFGKSYFVKVTGFKGIRQNSNIISFNVVAGAVPTVSVLCAQPKFCLPASTGMEMLVSKTNDLVLFGNCSGSSSCVMGDYLNWNIIPVVNGVLSTKLANNQLTSTSNRSETGYILRSKFYQDNPSINRFLVCFEIGYLNSFGSGCSQFSLMPPAPTIGSCSTNIPFVLPAKSSGANYCANCTGVTGQQPLTYNFYREFDQKRPIA
ncbi:hypothetical protein Ciccas_006787 [Cichlidogyrus casuarinus]|uniref:PKD/REJ-like domain-containing protein n=1 Tax=Cichlidogyrus casuarinus TaxID=1844966 RepID=A0ABD2Q4T4_9PLAT